MYRYLISYDLRVGATSDDYTRIIGAITQLGGRKLQFSQWAVRSNATAQQILDYLLPVIDANDRVLVAEFTENWASYNLEFDINQL